MTALRGNRRSSQTRIRSTCTVVSLNGHATYRTPALSAVDATWFGEQGFVVAQSLVMLRREGPSMGQQTAAVDFAEMTCRHLLAERRQTLLTQLLAIDGTSFDVPWNMTRDVFRHACQSTREHRVIVATHDGTMLGFAIVGRAGLSAYLQRLAVTPTERRRGVARSLVHHASQWAVERGASDMLVNTEPTNTAALRLYHSLGFVASAAPLVVMERVVNLPSPDAT